MTKKMYGCSAEYMLSAEWQPTSLFISHTCADGCFALEHGESMQSPALNMPSTKCYAKMSSFHLQQVANLLKYQ